MTVAELIGELEKIENKNLDVVCPVCGDYAFEKIEEVQEDKEWYGKYENNDWVCDERKCIKISG